VLRQAAHDPRARYCRGTDGTARDSGSEMQLRDVRTRIDESFDWPYLKDWAAKLGVAAKLDEVSK
jgi:hypothetical protein